ncbi:MAG TPA: CorA family divalent cation transporter [Candidatus Lokiarchaeia archaeon]|nr:CorA family divalent cation transporter [Candidatus Lokiarchaeia archaeon]
MNESEEGMVFEEKDITFDQLKEEYHPASIKDQCLCCFLDILIEDQNENYDSNKEALELSKALDIETDEFEDIFTDQRPRIEIFDWLFVFFKSVTQVPSDPRNKREFLILMKILENVIITIHREKEVPIEKFFKSLRRHPQHLKEGRVTYMFSRYIEALLNETYAILKHWSKMADEMERNLTAKSGNLPTSFLEDIAVMRYGLFDITKIMQANTEVIAHVTQGVPFLDKALLPPEIEDHARHIIDEAEILRSFMSDLMSVYYSADSARLNKSLARFTFATSLLLLPNLIATIFGMNNPGFPQISFMVALVIMLFADIVLFVFFRRKKII